MIQELQPTQRPDIARIVNLAVNGLDSPDSRRAYRRVLDHFLAWYMTSGAGGLTKATVNDYRAALLKQGVTESVVNLSLSAIRRLAREAADNGLIDDATAQAIKRVPNIARRGERAGNWLTKQQAEALINAPGRSSLLSKRDRALLGVLVGCGLRREEAARLQFTQIQQREGRWAIVDLTGKRNKLRTIPMPAWAKALIDAWAHAAGLQAGFVFVEVTKTGKLQTGNTTGKKRGGAPRTPSGHMTAQSIMNCVKRYGAKIAMPDLAPHDLRRTFAKLAEKGGAPLEQIRINLGHENLGTTQKYLGGDLDYQRAPADYLGLDVSMK